MHQKIAVIDERTVMIGSLTTLSQAWTREVTVTMRGGYFVRKLLEHEHGRAVHPPAEVRPLRRHEHRAAAPPWRCYETVCKTGPNGRSNTRNQDIRWRGQELRDRTMFTPARGS
ncbi:hypothetical protein ACFVP3_28325 [Streptomyces sp. NPDC057806]|uniref:hypothetical protein n=1 Tax=Streptomyces sp. NPDC057806 TaxID=3346255 RepID=UPI00368839FC